jgi:hypothetical protein
MYRLELLFLSFFLLALLLRSCLVVFLHGVSWIIDRIIIAITITSTSNRHRELNRSTNLDGDLIWTSSALISTWDETDCFDGDIATTAGREPRNATTSLYNANTHYNN